MNVDATAQITSGAEMRMSGGESAYRGAGGVPEELVKELEKQFGFDKPVHERLWKMIKDYVRFDFGRSYYQDKSVLELIAERMPVSVSLGLWSTLIIYLIAIPLGIKKQLKTARNSTRGRRLRWCSARRCRFSCLPFFSSSFCRRHLFSMVSAERTDFRQLERTQCRQKSA